MLKELKKEVEEMIGNYYNLIDDDYSQAIEALNMVLTSINMKEETNG